MNSEKISKLISNYLNRFDDIQKTNHEVYKWPVLLHFQKKWDLSRPDFGQMLKEAFSEDTNLIGSRYTWPLSGLVKLCELNKDCEEYVREAFIDLSQYEKGNAKDKQHRVDLFVKKINEKLTDNKFEGGYMQDFKNVINFLAFMDPQENYLLKVSYAHTFASYMEFGDDIGYGSYFNLSVYNRLCDEIVKELGNNPEFIERFEQELIKEAVAYGLDKVTYLDMPGKLQIMAYDLIYIARQQNLYDGIEKPINVKKSSKQVKKRRLDEIETELQEVVMELDTLEDAEDENLVPELVGVKITHKKYGDGTIVKTDDNRFDVSFADKRATFIFPDAFVNKYLSSEVVSLDVCQAIYDKQESIKKLKSRIRLLEARMKCEGSVI